MVGELESKAPEEGAGIHKNYNDKFVVGHALVAIFICSVIIMASILNISFDSGCWGSKTKWLFACATISAIVCAAWLAIFKIQEDLSQKLAPSVRHARSYMLADKLALWVASLQWSSEPSAHRDELVARCEQ